MTTAVRVTPDTLPYPDLDPTKAPYEMQLHAGKKHRNGAAAKRAKKSAAPATAKAGS